MTPSSAASVSFERIEVMESAKFSARVKGWAAEMTVLRKLSSERLFHLKFCESGKELIAAKDAPSDTIAGKDFINIWILLKSIEGEMTAARIALKLSAGFMAARIASKSKAGAITAARIALKSSAGFIADRVTSESQAGVRTAACMALKSSAGFIAARIVSKLVFMTEA